MIQSSCILLLPYFFHKPFILRSILNQFLLADNPQKGCYSMRCFILVMSHDVNMIKIHSLRIVSIQTLNKRDYMQYLCFTSTFTSISQFVRSQKICIIELQCMSCMAFKIIFRKHLIKYIFNVHLCLYNKCDMRRTTIMYSILV